jgi:hypothetical protein
MRLLFVTRVGSGSDRVYGHTWRSRLNLLLISKLHSWARPVSPVARYVEVGRELGHEVALFSEPLADLPQIPCSLDVERFDFALFLVYEANDFPDLPSLARLLDGVPREKRILLDCSGRYNETIRVEHDFNHLERVDGHQAWEWMEGYEAVSGQILQPTLHPLRPDVTPFLFHGFHPPAVFRPYSSPTEAARAWQSSNGSKPYGLAYVGNNWQRWSQLAPLLEALAPLSDRLGTPVLSGWDWDKRPDWAVEHGLAGVDVDVDLLVRLRAETTWGVPFNEFIEFTSRARFSPIVQRPLYNHLGLVTNRAFETFCADTIPMLMLPEEMVDEIYGDSARQLVPGDDVAGFAEDALAHPEPYWEAVLATREHLARQHSFERRFAELLAILDGGGKITDAANASR